MKKDAARFIKRAEGLGYRRIGDTNAKGFLTLAGPDGHEVRVHPSADEGTCRRLTVEARRGVAAAPNKRNTDAIKARRDAERQQATAERAQHQAVLDRITADNEAMHARRLAADCTAAEWAAIARQLEANDRQARETRALMGAPASRGARAHHRNGSGEA